jgi:hypothetical protein
LWGGEGNGTAKEREGKQQNKVSKRPKGIYSLSKAPSDGDFRMKSLPDPPSGDDSEERGPKDVWGILLSDPPPKYGEYISGEEPDRGKRQAAARKEFMEAIVYKAVDWLETAGECSRDCFSRHLLMYF